MGLGVRKGRENTLDVIEVKVACPERSRIKIVREDSLSTLM